MEHFPIVRALCRAALANSSPALEKQVERLRDALVIDGEKKQATALTALLSADQRTKEMAPSRLARSRLQVPGETLSRSTPVPVDRETSAPLAELLFPGDLSAELPLFDPSVTTAIKSVIEEWANIEALSAINLQPAKTCLIYGAPGTGKTRLAHWIAFTLDLPIVLVRLDGLISSFLGTTARNIGNLFAFVNRHRCLLLLDEFDAIAKVRDDPHEVGEIKRVVNALLQNLDSRKDLGLTLGITNHEALLDPAIWRRFDVQLEIPKPNFQIRFEIAQHFMPPLEVSESHLRFIAWCTEGCTGAEIESLVRSYKKTTTVGSQKKQSMLDALRQYATLNSARLNAQRREFLFSDTANLFYTIKNDPQLSFSLTDIGELSGRNKSTISRVLARIENDSEKRARQI